MGLAFGITLLPYIHAEINVSVIVLPVCAEHLWFNNHIDDEDHQSQLVTGPRKCEGGHWNLVAIMYTSWDFVIAYLLPVNGGHLLFTSHPDVGVHLHQSQRVAGLRKCGDSHWTLVAITYTSWVTRFSSLLLLHYIHLLTLHMSTFDGRIVGAGLQDAILDFPLPVPSGLVVQHWLSGPRKHRYSRWNFVAILCTSRV